MNLYASEFKVSERDEALHNAAKRYVVDCEAYDRTVCTGPETRDGIMPEGHVQQGLIVRNSNKMLDRLSFETGFSRSEIVRASARIDPRSPV